jgi:hypothetical protein
MGATKKRLPFKDYGTMKA